MFILTKAAQPTTSVDTSSWFDQGAGGGQPKDVSSLFADDPESVGPSPSLTSTATSGTGVGLSFVPEALKSYMGVESKSRQGSNIFKSIQHVYSD